MEITKNKTLSSKAAAFIKIWDSIGTKNEKEEQYCVLTTKLNGSLQDAFSYLRESPSDFIFLHGINEEKRLQVYGLLCTDTPRQLADYDSCFFVGEVRKKEVSDCFVLTAYHLEELCGEDTRYRIGDLVLMDSEEAKEAEVGSFLAALENTFVGCGE